MSEDRRERFTAYVEALAEVIGHADRVEPLHDYCLGLLLPGERKSVEPIAAVTAPTRVSAKHQSLLHFVANAPWSDERVLRARSKCGSADLALCPGSGAGGASRRLAGRTAGRRMIADRMARGRRRARQVLAGHRPAGHAVRSPGRSGQAALAHRTRLPGAETGTNTTVAFLRRGSDLLSDGRERMDERRVDRGNIGAVGRIVAGGEGADAPVVHAGPGGGLGGSVS